MKNETAEKFKEEIWIWMAQMKGQGRMSTCGRMCPADYSALTEKLASLINEHGAYPDNEVYWAICDWVDKLLEEGKLKEERLTRRDVNVLVKRLKTAYESQG